MKIKEIDKLKDLLAQNKKSVILLHSDDVLREILPFLKEARERCIIIPTSPEVLFSLDDLAEHYKILESYYSPEEYQNYFGPVNQKIINFSLELDAIITQSFPNIKQKGLAPASFNFYSFIRMFHPLIDGYFKIKKIVERERPDKIIIFSEENQFVREPGLEGWLLWGPKEDIMRKIIKSHDFGCKVIDFKVEEQEKLERYHFKISFFQKLLRKNIRLRYFLKLFKRDAMLALLIFFHQRTLKPLLLLNNGYDWEFCHNEFYKKGFYVYGQINDILEDFIDNNTQEEHVKTALKLVKNNALLQELLHFDNFDMYPLLEEKITIFLEKIVPACLVAYEKFLKVIAQKNIKALLFSVNPTAISKSISLAAKNSGVKVIGWQHGDANYEALDPIIFNDMFLADIFLSWGPGSDENRAKGMNRLSLHPEVKIIGSSMLDSLMVNRERGLLTKLPRPFLVYVPSMYYFTNSYLFSPEPYSDNNVYDSQRKIIEGFKNIKSTNAIPLHPNPFYASKNFYDYCKSVKNTVVFKNEYSLFELFFASDAIIINIPSTTVLQAVALSKPVFCLTRHLKISQKAKELLAKRAVVSDSPEKLIEAVQVFCKSGEYGADINNNEFLEYFGTRSDGLAAERAVEAVANSINKYND